MHQRAKYYKDQQCHSLQLWLNPYSPHSSRARESFLEILEWGGHTPITDGCAAVHPTTTSLRCTFRISRHGRCMPTHSIPRLSPSPHTTHQAHVFDHFLVQTGLKTTACISYTPKGGVPLRLQDCNALFITFGADVRIRRLPTEHALDN